VGYYPSLQERKKRLIEDVCASCDGGDATNEGGADEYTADVNFDTIHKDKTLEKGIDKVRKAKKKPKKAVTESKKEKPSMKMRLKASDLDVKADKESDKEKKMRMIDRARRIRQELD